VRLKQTDGSEMCCAPQCVLQTISFGDYFSSVAPISAIKEKKN
jgi:hypothetical protein